MYSDFLPQNKNSTFIRNNANIYTSLKKKKTLKEKYEKWSARTPKVQTLNINIKIFLKFLPRHARLISTYTLPLIWLHWGWDPTLYSRKGRCGPALVSH